MTNITVIKRHGTKEPLNINKWQDQIAKVCSGIADVSQSMIEIKSQPHFYNGITTKEIDGITLRAIVDLINVETNPSIGHTNYQFVAGKQRLSMLRKDIYGTYYPPSLYSIVQKNVAAGVYTTELLEWYTEDDWNKMDAILDHSKDEQYSYAAIEQLIEKYLVRNRATKELYETPQVRYMVAAATVFHNEEPNTARMKYIKEYYNCASDGLFTLATPVLAGLGTPTKQFSSCVVIKADDNLDSIFAAGEMMAKYASKRAGIGLDVSRIRPLGAPIRKGEIMHTGMVPFLKKWFGDLRSCCLRPDMYVEVLKETGNGTCIIQIQEAAIGQQIKTMLPNGTVTYRTITDKFESVVEQDEQVYLIFKSKTGIHCSTNHPIMCQDGDNQTQVLPKDLTVDHRIITNDGITSLQQRIIGQTNPTKYIDITVEDTHTFFTSEQFGGRQVLTHNSQGGIRNSSCTVSYCIWTYQFDDLIVLKNNQGTDETRVRHMDYCVVLSAFFWRRFKNKEDITFFDPNEVPELYQAFYTDIDLFEKLYVEYEARTDLRTKTMSAEEVFKSGLLKERTDTGRIYLMYVDNVMNQGPFDPSVHTIYQTNLCCLTGDSILEIIYEDIEEFIIIEDFTKQWNSGAYTSPVYVKSWDKGEEVWKPVTNAMLTKHTKDLIEIESDTGPNIRCTPDHQIFTTTRGWVQAQYLSLIDELIVDSNRTSIATISKVQLENAEPVYDITVEDTHSFFANGILVHNCEIMLPTRPFNSLDDEGEFKLTLDDNSVITLPGQHQVLLEDGTKKKVRELDENDDISNLLI